MSNKYQRQYLKSFLSYSQIKLPFLLIKLPKTLPWIMLLIIMFLSLAPWIQTSKGFGYVISRNPTLNSQNIESLVSGRIAKWYVKEGQLVRKGDKILEISDNDPLLIARIKAENAAKRNKLANARLISETSKINYLRQEKLYLQGISSKLSFEEAKINYQKNLSNEEQIKAELNESEIKVARQDKQVIFANNDGVITNLIASDINKTVKVGDRIATLIPNIDKPAVELFINANDLGLIRIGRTVRLQFSGLPIMQISGWPNLAYGTFGGVVTSIDKSVNNNGSFRIIVENIDNELWPDNNFLAYGSRAYGWVLLDEVKIGYELWRKLNDFPANFNPNFKLEKNSTISNPK